MVFPMDLICYREHPMKFSTTNYSMTQVRKAGK